MRGSAWAIKNYPRYTFTPLDSTWEPGPPPTENCVMFLGKQDTGTHIGVFLHSTPPGGPRQLMREYLADDSVSKRTVLVPPEAFLGGVYAACENQFSSMGAAVRAFEAYVILPTQDRLIGFTFKRRIEVDSRDFRREAGAQVAENLRMAVPEHAEFLDFVRGFREQRGARP